jgi:hypothetical protein
MGDDGSAGEQERMICQAGAAIGALPCVLRSQSHPAVTAQAITTG